MHVCTQLPVLEAFVADTERFSEWLPYTRHAELLEQADDHLIYYVRIQHALAAEGPGHGLPDLAANGFRAGRHAGSGRAA